MERERERERKNAKKSEEKKTKRGKRKKRKRVISRNRLRYSVLPGRDGEEEEGNMFYLTTHSTHFIYGYMASDISLRTILIVRKKTRCCYIGYSYRLTARVLLYAPSHRQDNTYHIPLLHQSWSTGWNEK